MKKLKKAVTMVVMLMMIGSLLSVCAFARTTNDPYPIELPYYVGKPYEFYTFFGDSVPAGGALWYDGTGKDIGEYGFMRINWSFPDFLAETINENYTGGWDTSGFHNDMGLAWSDNIGAYGLRGVRVGDVRMMIERGYKQDYYSMTDSYSTEVFYPQYLEPSLALYSAFSIDKYAEIQTNLRKSDLITLTVGSNDVFTVPLAKMILDGKIDLTQPNLIPELNEITSVEDILNNVTALYEYVLSSGDLLSEFFSLVNQGVKDIAENYPALLADINEINGGKADIIVMGIYNPFEGLKITEKDTNALITNALSNFTEIVNKTIKKACDKYPNVYYVDTMGVETQLSLNGVTLSDPSFGSRMLKEIHPTIAGHLDIAGRITKVLNGINNCPHDHTEIKNKKEASELMLGYSGDTYCSDCGKLLEKGSLVTYRGLHIGSIRPIIANVYNTIKNILASVLDNIPFKR